jgi:uncharacterized protein with von Willebrand factor type A (vWA) domain
VTGLPALTGLPSGEPLHARLAAAFGRALRLAGLEVPVSAVVSYAEALEAVGLLEADHVFWAGRAVFVRRPEDGPVYARVFASFWSALPLPVAASQDAVPATLLLDDAGHEQATESPSEDERPDREAIALRYSATEVLRDKDFANLSQAELAEAYELIAALRARSATRPTRRRRPVRHGHGVLDVRRTVRHSLRAGGEPVLLRRLARSQRHRRVVVLVDVSGSMEPYARAFLRFAHAAVIARRDVEVFTIGTRLTRVTRELRWHDPDAALSRAVTSVADISGGTRLGPSLRAFNDRYGASGIARGAIVVMLSDGWDRGDPTELGEEMARLSRLAYRIVWVNPLKATPGYAPLARGMAAALPYVDEFVEGHSFGALEHLVVEVMAR